MAESATILEMRPKQKLLEARIDRAEIRNTYWSAVIPHGVAYEDILEPSFWVHVAGPKNMAPGDKIEVTPDDGSYIALLYVRDCGSAYGAKVSEIWKKDFGGPQVVTGGGDMPTGFKIEWRGLSDKHVVVREKDNVVIQRGFKHREDAQMALLEHLKSLRA